MYTSNTRWIGLALRPILRQITGYEANFWKIDNINNNDEFRRVYKKNNCEYKIAKQNNSIL